MCLKSDSFIESFDIIHFRIEPPLRICSFFTYNLTDYYFLLQFFFTLIIISDKELPFVKQYLCFKNTLLLISYNSHSLYVSNASLLCTVCPCLKVNKFNVTELHPFIATLLLRGISAKLGQNCVWIRQKQILRSRIRVFLY